MLAELKPERGGFVFDPVRERRLEAGERGGEFGFLFLCFSFFLIAAALLLVGLLFRLNLDRRAAEIGLLLAAGFRTRTVRRLLLGEGGLVALLGGLLGTVWRHRLRLAAAGNAAFVVAGLARSFLPAPARHADEPARSAMARPSS